MSTRYLTRDELFVYRDERSDAAERRADRAERFAVPTDDEVKHELERRNMSDKPKQEVQIPPIQRFSCRLPEWTDEIPSLIIEATDASRAAELLVESEDYFPADKDYTVFVVDPVTNETSRVAVSVEYSADFYATVETVE